MSKTLTAEDLRSAIYFVRHKDDITRWVDWDNVKQRFVDEYPDFVKALLKVEKAKKRLDRELDCLESEIYRLEE